MTYSDSGLTAEREKYIQLSPAIVYYIRKLLRQNLDRLQFVVASGAGLRADHLSNLNVVIQSLYLEETQIQTVILDLERLSLSHQALSSQASLHRQELVKLETQIFWLLGFKQQAIKQNGKILIVDDNPENLRLLSIALSQQGYDVRSAISGSMALSGLRSIMPDLILLDVMMPGMNGYEVCGKIKADTLTQDIPIIFISAVNEVIDKVKSFRLGGVDFITKPFQIEEVLLRIEHQLSICSLKKRLEEQNVRLQQEMRDREQAFQESRETESKAIEETRQQMQARLDQRWETIERLTRRLDSKGTAARLKGEMVADRAESTVLFASLVNFTAFADQAPPAQVVDTISQIFSAFDRLVEQLGVTKIKTIGTTYIAAGGIPTPRTDHAQTVADLALAMQKVLLACSAAQSLAKPLRLRIGIHTGAAIGGTVGTRQYDLWGNTVNIANQMQSAGAAGRILVTATTGEALRNRYLLEPRGNLLLEGKVEMMTYWLLNRRQESTVA